jgi:TnpA family transposase
LTAPFRRKVVNLWKTQCFYGYLHEETLRGEIHEGLKVTEQWNGANDFVFFAWRLDLSPNDS